MAVLSEVRSVKRGVMMVSLIFFILQMVLALQKYSTAPKMSTKGNKVYLREAAKKAIYWPGHYEKKTFFVYF